MRVQRTHRRSVLAAVLAVAALFPAAAQAATPRHGDAIVRFDRAVTPAQQRAAIRSVGGAVVRDLHVIHALGVRLGARAAVRLARAPGVLSVSPDAHMRASAADPGQARWATWDPKSLSTAFVQSARADKVWTDSRYRATGTGVAVAVIDTGIAGQVADFRTSRTDGTSRVLASVVTNPDATTSTDLYGHGTHVAGIVAGNSAAADATDPLTGRYAGTAPTAGLVSLKASDDHGDAYVSDVIAALQFVVDHGADYGVRVVNLSLASSVALPAAQDPLDAAVEAVWAHGVVVVVAAGNRGTASDAVSYAPANDPYVITVGAVDDQGTKDTADDTVAPWSSRGVTQDGVTKPDLLAPGAHIAAPLAPGSDFAALCPACTVDARYFRVSGTSMAAPVVSGVVADLLSAHPDWTPDQVKGALTYLDPVPAPDGTVEGNLRGTADGGWEVAADSAIRATRDELVANVGLTPSPLLDAASGWLDPARASWGRASWKGAAGGLRASWGAASWTCDCPMGSDAGAGAATTRASWRRASWGRASWKAFFGDDPSQYGELAGDESGAVPAPRSAAPARQGNARG